MKIRVQQCHINSVPSVIIYTFDWDRSELDCLLRFGEPSIDIGGKFYKNDCHTGPEDSNDEQYTEYEDTDEYFVIPSKLKRIRTDFPIMEVFSQERFSDPQLVGKIWADEVARRIAVEVKNLRYNGSLFSKEETYEV